MEKWKPVSAAALTGALGALFLIAWLRWRSAQGWIPILDDANLAFHEAGHPIIGLLGERFTVYGGTIGQLTFPAIASFSFWRQGEPTGFALSLSWLFENFWNIGRYMADARVQLLLLVGNGEHDWTDIFSAMACSAIRPNDWELCRCLRLDGDDRQRSMACQALQRMKRAHLVILFISLTTTAAILPTPAAACTCTLQNFGVCGGDCVTCCYSSAMGGCTTDPGFCPGCGPTERCDTLWTYWGVQPSGSQICAIGQRQLQCNTGTWVDVGACTCPDCPQVQMGGLFCCADCSCTTGCAPCTCGSGSPSPPPPPPSCNSVGVSCSSNSDCCSLVCLGGTCTCLANGSACAVNNNCCGGICSGNICGVSPPPPPGCTSEVLILATEGPSPVASGGTFTITCNYGVVSGEIIVTSGAGPCVGPTWSGTTGTWTCTATAANGIYPDNCSISGPTYCTADPSHIGDVTVGLPPPPPPPPPAPACPGLTAPAICGSMTALEDGTPLSGIPVELRNNRGSVIKISKSAAGTYSFDSLSVGATYYVAPVVNRTESASPLHRSIPNIPSGGVSGQNFKIRGVPASITISGTPGAFVLLKAGSAFSGSSNPPPISAGIVCAGDYYSWTIGIDGSVQVQVPGGFKYWLTCWTPQRTGSNITYTRMPSTGMAVNNGNTVSPASPAGILSASCP